MLKSVGITDFITVLSFAYEFFRTKLRKKAASHSVINQLVSGAKNNTKLNLKLILSRIVSSDEEQFAV